MRPIQQIHVISRTPGNAEKLAAEIATWANAPQVNIAATPQAAIAQADLIITATTSRLLYLTETMWLRGLILPQLVLIRHKCNRCCHCE